MNTPLYVVDMQPGYPGSFNIIDEVIREIKLAKRRKDVIAFVTLSANSGYGNTHPQLIDAAISGRYERVLYTTKVSGDGSHEFIHLMNSVKEPYKRVRVCGVNRGACVWNTVLGLIKNLSQSVSIELACDATSDGLSKGQHLWDHTGYIEKEYIKLAEQGKIKLVFHK